MQIMGYKLLNGYKRPVTEPDVRVGGAGVCVLMIYCVLNNNTYCQHIINITD